MTPFDLIISSPSQFSVKTTNEYVAGLKDTLSTAYEAVRSNTRVAAERQKKQYDTKVRPAEFAVGKLVWVYYPRAWKRRSPKWSNNYVGPCLVERRMNAVNYVVKRTPKSKLWVVHVDKLKPFVREWPSIWREFEQEVTELPIERHTMHCSDSKPSASGAEDRAQRNSELSEQEVTELPQLDIPGHPSDKPMGLKEKCTSSMAENAFHRSNCKNLYDV